MPIESCPIELRFSLFKLIGNVTHTFPFGSLLPFYFQSFCLL
uniref:Uncharacterized protein n=1 Tax=Arundo donax TaxID=35708 RepID=A0A0A9H439_ARUDO